MNRKISTLVVLAAALFVIQSAKAVPHYSGSVEYNVEKNGRHLSGRIDFAVFDTTTDSYAFTPPGEGRYLYAYQIWNDEGGAQEALGYFSILLEGATVDGIGFEAPQNDTAAIEPTDAFISEADESSFDGNADFFFELYPPPGLVGEAMLEPGEHSYILLYTSDNDWRAGEYRIRGSGGLANYESPFGGGYETNTLHNPEPATLFILGSGAGMVLLSKKKKSRSG